MFRLRDVLEDRQALIRDAAFDRTDFSSAAQGRALSYAVAPKHLRPALTSSGVVALVVTPELAELAPESFGLVVHDDPEILFYQLHNRLARDFGMGVNVAHEVHPTARIHPSAVVEQGCSIGPGVVVEAGAVIQAGTVLEQGVHVGPRAVVGFEGSFSKRRPGRVLKVLHAGGVHVGAEAEIQTGVMVGRAVHPDFTRIGRRTLVSGGATISHGVSLDDDVSVGGSAVICGYTRVGARSWVGPSATVANLIEIGEDARVEIGATVVRSISPGSRYSGLFARPHREMRHMSLALRDLAERARDGS